MLLNNFNFMKFDKNHTNGKKGVLYFYILLQYFPMDKKKYFHENTIKHL